MCRQSKTKKGHKVFWVSAVVILLVISVLVVLLNRDSEKILQHKLSEKEVNKFDASKYPLVLDKTKYPELSSVEKKISEEYKPILQIFSEKFKRYDYECRTNPQLSKLNLAYLKPKQTVYLIESYCGVYGEPSPYTGVPHILFYVSRGDVVMFYRDSIVAHFTELFDNIRSLEQLEEYLTLHSIKLFVDLDSALNNSLLGARSSENFKTGCDFVSSIPKLNSTFAKAGDGFIYEGLRIEPELNARLYHLKYNITSDGQIVKDTDKMLAFCPKMGIIY